MINTSEEQLNKYYLVSNNNRNWYRNIISDLFGLMSIKQYIKYNDISRQKKLSSNNTTFIKSTMVLETMVTEIATHRQIQWI